jgi:16S rRNA (guanine966-N2)-methyltransferase
MTRIVGGTAGGRRLAAPRGRGTRPTAERTREGLFSTLEAVHRTLHGRAFLDLYAGSGAVGLEAASRGSAPVLLVEHAPGALAALRSNVAALDLTDVEIIADQVERLLTRPAPQMFDIVFLDPPYADPVDPVLQMLVDNGWLADDATVVVERATRSGAPAWPAELSEDRVRRYGDSTLWYGRRP